MDALTALTASAARRITSPMVREFIGTYSQRGLVIIISDFLDDKGCERALQYLCRFRPRVDAGAGLDRRGPHAALGPASWSCAMPRPGPA